MTPDDNHDRSNHTATVPLVNGEMRNRVQGLRLDSQLAASKASRGGGTSWLPWVLCLVMAAAWAGVGIRSYKAGAFNSNTTTEAGTTTGPPTGSKPVAAPAPGVPGGSIQIEVKGYLVPAQLISVSPIDVGGRVVELNVVEGKLFKQGDVLARLEDISYKAAVEEAKATWAGAKQRLESTKLRRSAMMPKSVRKVEVDQATAEMKEAEAQQSRALDQMTRLEKLGASASDQELRQARFDWQASEARVRRLTASLDLLVEGPRKESKDAAEAESQASEADVRAAEARLAAAQWRLDNCVIRAPIDGTVLTKKAEKWNLVNPNAFAGGSGSVCEMADLADLEVDLEIPERDISKLLVGQPCRIKADAFPDKQYAGKLDRIMPTANRAKSIVNVRVKVKLPAGEVPGTILKPEMGAVVSFLSGQ